MKYHLFSWVMVHWDMSQPWSGWAMCAMAGQSGEVLDDLPPRCEPCCWNMCRIIYPKKWPSHVGRDIPAPWGIWVSMSHDESYLCTQTIHSIARHIQVNVLEFHTAKKKWTTHQFFLEDKPPASWRSADPPNFLCNFVCPFSWINPGCFVWIVYYC